MEKEGELVISNGRIYFVYRENGIKVRVPLDVLLSEKHSVKASLRW